MNKNEVCGCIQPFLGGLAAQVHSGNVIHFFIKLNKVCKNKTDILQNDHLEITPPVDAV